MLLALTFDYFDSKPNIGQMCRATVGFYYDFINELISVNYDFFVS